MYKEIYAKNGSLKHSNECQMSFGHKDKECPRCQELINGSLPRSGWQKKYYENKKQEEQNRLNAIKNHDCKKSNCGFICTAFEW